MVSKFSQLVKYTEKEVNALLNQYHTFNDPALLRREMVERKLLARMRDGSAYWRLTASVVIETVYLVMS